MKILRSAFWLTILCFAFQNSIATTYNVLFLGNSYVYVNDLPQLTANVAASNGDTIIFDSYCPGSYTLQSHFNDGSSIAKISQGNWDFVILQEQSQLPSFPIGQVTQSVYPYAHKLDSLINYYNPCAETMFYMTWGRKNGDASNCSSWPPVCTYEGMDSLLNLRYRTMAFDNEATVAPVGAVWKYIRTNFPTIELYQSDESHPSLEGSYAAACTFYSSIFRKDPTNITFSSTIDSLNAVNIRQAVKSVTFNSFNNWYIGAYDPKADFTYTNTTVNTVSFQNNSINANDYYWDFGDGGTSTYAFPSHYFPAPGLYYVSLTSFRCSYSDTMTGPVNVLNTGIAENYFGQDAFVFPNPATDKAEIHIGDPTLSFDKFELINSLGEIVLEQNFRSSSYNLDVQSLPRGFYFISLTSGDKQLKKLPLILN